MILQKAGQCSKEIALPPVGLEATEISFIAVFFMNLQFFKSDLRVTIKLARNRIGIYSG